MPKRELTETEKALRQEQLVERKMLAAAMRLKEPTARRLAAEHVYKRLLGEEMRSSRASVPFVSATRLAPAGQFEPDPPGFDRRNRATCDPSLDVGGEGGA